MVFYLATLTYDNKETELLDFNIVACGNIDVLVKLSKFIMEYNIIISSCDELYDTMKDNDILISNKLCQNFVEKIDNDYFDDLPIENELKEEVDELLLQLFA